MGVPAAMQSLLMRQLLALDAGWDARYPHDWIIWEPGAWKVPASSRSVVETQFGTTEPPGRPTKGDCLCFELKSASGKLKLGRAPENDLVINDATVSREHVIFERKGAQWTVQSLPNTKPVTVRSSPLSPGTALPINSADRITVGGVTLSYFTPSGLKERLKAEAKKIA